MTFFLASSSLFFICKRVACVFLSLSLIIWVTAAIWAGSLFCCASCNSLANWILLWSCLSNFCCNKLVAYEQLIANYFATNKPPLGKTDNQEVISDENYQLLDKILTDFQDSLPEEEENEENNNPNTPPQDGTPLFSPAVASLSTQAQEMEKKIAQLISSANPANTNDPAEYMKILKGILLKSTEGKKILTDIKAWLTDYQQITSFINEDEKNFSLKDVLTKNPDDPQEKLSAKFIHFYY
ncbi:MAG: hypothetical protein mread185_000148 [Mycoplasmataceae bacterium]|nr:MAG: hypothetical protein mread185_000148 [Mycoplasmataceae bacterium]